MGLPFSSLAEFWNYLLTDPYVKLGVASFLPVIAAVFLYLLDKKTAFGKLPYILRQILFGLVFGGLAVVGTEWGIPINGAQVNCRDAAVLAGGLMFGAPTGIIAGLIGGIERWFAVYWGVGTFTRVACSISTIIAGFYAAILRKFMFENKKPGTFISLAIGVVMEIFHLTMVFLTNMGEPEKAIRVVYACTLPMVTANGISVMLTAACIALISGDNIFSRKKQKARISQTVQSWLLFTVIVAFAATSVFVYRLQTEIANRQTEDLLSLALDEVADDVKDASDQNLLNIASRVSSETNSDSLWKLKQRYGLAEINMVGRDGVIFDTTEILYFGFDMHSGEQSAEFLCLLDDTYEYVQEYGPVAFSADIMRKYAGVKTSYGFLQVGYDAEGFQSDLALQVSGVTKNRHVGNTGYILILDRRMNLVSAPKNLVISASDRRGIDLLQPDTTFTASIGGIENYCQYRNVEGYYVLSVLPVDEALEMRNVALYVNTFMEILVFAILFALIYLLIKKIVVNRIKDINGDLARITGGDLGVVVDVRTNEEFASLSDDINATVDTLKHYIDEASARIDEELEFAKNIQASALPRKFPAFPKRQDFDIYASMNPAKEVGGDFYDFYMTEDGRLHFLIADVSGKGIPAAMFMMRAKTELKTLTEAGVPISEVFTHGNSALCEGNDAGMFVTAWQGGIDLSTGEVQFANAGHNPPLVRHASTGKFEYLRSRAGFVLAGMDGVMYKAQELKLEPGDSVYLYTDGVTEAQNADHELYGEDRLLEAINREDYPDVQTLCKAVKADVDAFVGDAPQFDDITMVALKYIGTPPAPSIHVDDAQISDIPRVTEFVEGELEKLECSMKIITQFSIAIDEICSNIIRYGYGSGKGPFTVEVLKNDDPATVSLRFTDEGVPYNPLTKEDPDVTLSAEERGIGGLGIYMVKKSMDDMRYEYTNGKNILTITKKL